MKHFILWTLSLMLIFPLLVLAGKTLRGEDHPAPSGRSVAVTFDDLPLNTLSRDNVAWQEMTTRLLGHIRAYQIPAIGFVNEGKLYPDDRLDSVRVHLLRQWLEAGLELGNHTYSHPDLHHTPLAEFLADLRRGEVVTRPLMREFGRELRYFRHPFLHTGRDLETKTGLEAYLQENGYTVAPVTIDNSEWIYARAYELSLQAKDSDQCERLTVSYIAYMDSKFAYFEDQARALFGREIPQVLLLHANRLNADYFGELAEMIRRRGYRFISLEEVLKDAAYGSEDHFTGSGGITWLHRWAITAGKSGEFFAGEPEAPAFVREAAGMR